MIESLIAIIAPHDCIVCGVENDLLCRDCGKKCITNDSACFFCGIALAKGELCEKCQKDLFCCQLTSVGWYVGDLKDIVYTYKFNGKRGAAKPLARLLADVSVVHSAAVISYIPTTAVHIRERGFDHAKLLAQRYAAEVSLPCIALLARTNNHRQLGASKSVRQKSIKGTFTSLNMSAFKNRDIILVDDVITTGSTFREAAKVLLEAGARSVSALVIAKTPAKR